MDYLSCPALGMQGRQVEMKEQGLIEPTECRRNSMAILREWQTVGMPKYELFVSDVLEQRQ